MIINKQNQHTSYDVVIIGGATMGTSVAWFLANNPDFDGKILVIDKDYDSKLTSTAASNNCMRQQFANAINVKIGLYAADFVNNFRANLGGDPAVPHIPIRSFGYLYLSDSPEFTQVLKNDQKTQAECGAGTKIISKEAVAAAYPFYNLEDIEAASLNTENEGYFDVPLMLEWMKIKAHEHCAEFIEDEVVVMDSSGKHINSVTLKNGSKIDAGLVINCAGPRATLISEMAGVKLPIEPRLRYTYIFEAAKPLDRDLPLTIDPTGVHFRQYGDDKYLVGCPPMGGDNAVGYDYFDEEAGIWEKKMYPILANRVPQFADIKVVESWMGHYEFNRFDCNAIVGPHTSIDNLMFVNGFSGHGSQQAPAMGRGIMELIVYGEFRTMDLTPFSFSRLENNQPLIERAVI